MVYAGSFLLNFRDSKTIHNIFNSVNYLKIDILSVESDRMFLASGLAPHELRQAEDLES